MKAEAILDDVLHGVALPFENGTPEPIEAKSNHVDLALRAGEVTQAIKQQLQEKSLRPWNVRAKGKPKGIYALRWVEKSNGKIRLTLNARPINGNFPAKDCTITLELHTHLKHKYCPNQMYLGFDLHNGFFNHSYREGARTWVCFKISLSEPPQNPGGRTACFLPELFHSRILSTPG